MSSPGSRATRSPMKAIKHASIGRCASTCRVRRARAGGLGLEVKQGSHLRDAAMFARATAAKSHGVVENRRWRDRRDPLPDGDERYRVTRPDSLGSTLTGAVQKSARSIGTPFWLYEAEPMRQRVRQLQAFDCIRFAQKANSNIHVLRLLRDMDVLVDAVSLGEIERAL